MRKIINNLLATTVIVVIALCFLFGVSYFVGWGFIGDSDVKTENVSLHEVKIFFGLIIVCVLYSVVRFIDFVVWIWSADLKSLNESSE